MKTKKPAAKPKACTCIDQVNEILKPDGYKVARSIQMNFDAGTVSMTPPFLLVERIGHAIRNGKRAPKVVCAHCPVCGKKYP